MTRAGDRPCYYLVGATGYPNYGDELIALVWLRFLARAAPEADVWLDCHSPGTAQTLLDGVHPRLRCVDTLWRLCGQAPPEQPWQVASWVRHAVADPGRAPRRLAGIEQLAHADLVHLIGGGYINGIWPRHIGLLAGAVAAVRRSGGRAAMTGQGLAPAAEDAAPLLRALADRFDVVEVRDAASAELLGRPEAHGVDDVFLGLDELLPGPRDDLPAYMLCLQADLLASSRAQLAGFVLSTLRSWRVPADEVGVVEAIPGGDREIFALLEHELPEARYYPFHTIWTAGLPVAAQQTWISTRFHLHLLAAAAGAGGVAVSINPDYYATKHRSLIDLGSRWALADDLAAVPQPSACGFGSETVARGSQRKQELGRAIYGAG